MAVAVLAAVIVVGAVIFFGVRVLFPRLIVVDTGPRVSVVKGRIAHSQIGELKDGIVLYRTGVEFVETSDHAQTALEMFVDALKIARRMPAIVDGQIAE